MSVPRVFHSKTRLTDPWGVRYRRSEPTDWFPEWEDAMRKAITWTHVSNTASLAAAEAEAARRLRAAVVEAAVAEATQTITYRGES